MQAEPSTDGQDAGITEKTGSVNMIVSEILRGLYDGRYVPGQKLVESDLTKRFGVGRGTVREALQRLEAEGLTTASLHRGARIRSFTRDGVRDLLEITEAIAGLTGRLAAERSRSTEDLTELRGSIEELSRLIEAGETFASAQLRFSILHAIAALACNQELFRLMPRYDASVVRAQFRVVFDAKGARAELEQFRKVLDYILARDGDGAELTMRKFVRRTAVAIQHLPDEYFDH
ncbi:MAG: GntR family transcriptional regulator [Sphingobium sp.]|uniref:GntR family transcriptional regulator n=1 Tax=Sphingobium sp. TaxID=1912891 RepID=UPI0029BDA17D|nr:GntR family transcriptional regulator [Sphingobium sp.]MDX3911574.1 GntR family transcriptional regulator [Sphingobium sp.]